MRKLLVRVLLSLLVDLEQDVNCAFLVDRTHGGVGLARGLAVRLVEDAHMLGDLGAEDPVITRELERKEDGVVRNLFLGSQFEPVFAVLIRFD